MKEWSDEAPRTTTTVDPLSHADARGRMEAMGVQGRGTTRGEKRVQSAVCARHLFYTRTATFSTDVGGAV